MWMGRAVTMVVMAVMVGGCAGGQTRQQLSRLQSQMGLLDERVTQLERSSPNISSVPAASLSESAGEVVKMPRVATSSKKGSASTEKVSSASALKPTTREIQQALKNAGFYQGPIDGKMGPQTHDAIKEFQRIQGLRDDGIVGKQTWVKLRAYATLSSNNGEVNAAEVLK